MSENVQTQTTEECGFEELGLTKALLDAIEGEGYERPTPIQRKAITVLLEGKDMLGCAQTGTGKTAAFALPTLQRLAASKPNGKKRPIRALAITPTRELAQQIADSFETYGRNTPMRTGVVYGGVSQVPQEKTLRRGIDILVATPGRLMDLMRQGLISLAKVEVFILDEADRMLDMGFINDVRTIVKAIPDKRQTLLFSATMPANVQYLADSILTQAVEVRIAQESPGPGTVEHYVYLVERKDKKALLQHLLSDAAIKRTLVFTRTKRTAERLAGDLKKTGVRADAIHSNKSQSARKRALDGFRNGRVRVLVASDIAARGIDVDDITHVINYDLPANGEVYVHRTGRTGRAGQPGIAWSFCAIEERGQLNDIEKLLRQEIATLADSPFHSSLPRIKKQKVKKWQGRGMRIVRRGRRR